MISLSNMFFGQASIPEAIFALARSIDRFTKAYRQANKCEDHDESDLSVGEEREVRVGLEEHVQKLQDVGVKTKSKVEDKPTFREEFDHGE